MNASRTPLQVLLTVAFGVVAIDLASKAAALLILSGSYVDLGGPFFLTLIFNDALFAGTSTLNGMALPISVFASLLLVALAIPVCAPLAEHDSRAPLALGLMVGAAVANPASLILQPAGVTDFLGVTLGDSGIVFNLADVAVYVGVALSGRTVMNVLAAHRAQRRSTARRTTRRAYLEREIPLAVWQDTHTVRPEPIPVPSSIPVMLADSRESIADAELELPELRVDPPA